MKQLDRQHLALMHAAEQARGTLRRVRLNVGPTEQAEVDRALASLTTALKARTRRAPTVEPLPWQVTR